MTVALLCSHADPASVNIRDRLRELVPWTITDDHLDGLPILEAEETGLLLVESPRMHLECDLIDRALAAATNVPIEAVLVLSKHRAASGSSALTVHPIGNWGEADFGGRARTVTPAAPALMARLLRALGDGAREARLSHSVTLEATHHGPFLETPTAFVEIGTTEDAWRDPRLGEVVARAVLEAASAPNPVVDASEPVLLAVGGSHYAPRATDLVRKRRASVAHVLPAYAVDAGVDADVVRQAVARSPGASGYFLDERGMKGDVTPVLRVLEEAGLQRVDATSLPAR